MVLPQSRLTRVPSRTRRDLVPTVFQDHWPVSDVLWFESRHPGLFIISGLVPRPSHTINRAPPYSLPLLLSNPHMAEDRGQGVWYANQPALKRKDGNMKLDECWLPCVPPPSPPFPFPPFPPGRQDAAGQQPCPPTRQSASTAARAAGRQRSLAWPPPISRVQTARRWPRPRPPCMRPRVRPHCWPAPPGPARRPRRPGGLEHLRSQSPCRLGEIGDCVRLGIRQGGGSAWCRR
jgi:hypothetical protein